MEGTAFDISFSLDLALAPAPVLALCLLLLIPILKNCSGAADQTIVTVTPGFTQTYLTSIRSQNDLLVLILPKSIRRENKCSVNIANKYQFIVCLLKSMCVESGRSFVYE